MARALGWLEQRGGVPVTVGRWVLTWWAGIPTRLDNVGLTHGKINTFLCFRKTRVFFSLKLCLQSIGGAFILSNSGSQSVEAITPCGMTLEYQNRSREDYVALSWLLSASAQKRIHSSALTLWCEAGTRPWLLQRSMRGQTALGCGSCISTETGQMSWGVRQTEEQMPSLGCEVCLQEEGGAGRCWSHGYLVRAACLPLLHGPRVGLGRPGSAFWVRGVTGILSLINQSIIACVTASGKILWSFLKILTQRVHDT